MTVISTFQICLARYTNFRSGVKIAWVKIAWLRKRKVSVLRWTDLKITNEFVVFVTFLHLKDLISPYILTISPWKIINDSPISFFILPSFFEVLIKKYTQQLTLLNYQRSTRMLTISHVWCKKESTPRCYFLQCNPQWPCFNVHMK